MTIRGLANWDCKPVSKCCRRQGRLAWAGLAADSRQTRDPAGGACKGSALSEYFSAPHQSQEYNIHLTAENVLNRWNQVVMMAKEDDLGLFGQCLKGFKTCF